MEIDQVTLITLVTISLASLAGCLRLVFKSKCSNFNLCFGMLEIKRNVELEADIELGKTGSEDQLASNKV